VLLVCAFEITQLEADRRAEAKAAGDAAGDAAGGVSNEGPAAHLVGQGGAGLRRSGGLDREQLLELL
jgi:hypothetical protein